jgi:hypothetical protein
LGFQYKKSLDPCFADLRIKDVLQRFPLLKPRYDNIPFQLKSFHHLFSVDSRHVGSDPRPARQLDDPFVRRFFQKESIDPPSGYLFNNAKYEDCYGEIMKYPRAPHYYFSQYYYDIIEKGFFARFLPFTIGSQLLSFNDVLPLIDPKTSPGFGYRRYFKTKDDMINWRVDSSTPLKLPFSSLHGICEDLWRNPYPSIFSVYPKEQTVTVEKYERKKVRTFIISPLPFNVNLMRYTSDFNRRLNDSVLKHPVFVGFNEWYGGWDAFIRKCKRVGSSWYALDLSQCDSTVLNQAIFMEFELRFNSFASCYQTPEHYERFRTYVSDHVFAHISIDGHVYRKSNGNSSGQPTTIYTNSFFLYILLYYCYLRYKSDRREPISEVSFNTDLYSFICGDDALFHFIGNSSRLLMYATELGATVKLDCASPRDVTENAFCSRSTILLDHHGQKLYAPVLDESAIRATWFYGMSRCSLRMSYLRTTQLMVLAFPHKRLYSEMSSYIQHLFEEYSDELTSENRDVCKLAWLEVAPSLKSYTQIMEQYFGRFYM